MEFFLEGDTIGYSIAGLESGDQPVEDPENLGDLLPPELDDCHDCLLWMDTSKEMVQLPKFSFTLIE